MHHLEFDKPKVLRHAPQSTSTKLACCTLHSSGMDTRAHGCTTSYRFPDWCLHKQLRTWGGLEISHNFSGGHTASKHMVVMGVHPARHSAWLLVVGFSPKWSSHLWDSEHNIKEPQSLKAPNPMRSLTALTSILSEWTQWAFPRSSITSRQRLDLAQEPVSNPQW